MVKQKINTELFSSRFSKLLEEKNETVYSVADYLSLSASTISRYANGKMEPKVTTLYAIAGYFNVNPYWLMGVDGAKREVEAKKDELSTAEPEEETIQTIAAHAIGELNDEDVEEIIRLAKHLLSKYKD